jgi:hypothetical protein
LVAPYDPDDHDDDLEHAEDEERVQSAQQEREIRTRDESERLEKIVAGD